MKFKKIAALCLTVAMIVFMVGCRNSDGDKKDIREAETTTVDADIKETENNENAKSALAGSLVIWTLEKDLETMAEKFMEENPDVTIQTTVIVPEEYVSKIETAILGGDHVIDVIVGEPQMLQPMFEAGIFEDLNALGCDAFAGDMVDYVRKVGQDADGIQRALSYQICPSGFYYRRDIAQEVFGYDDPESVGKLFSSYDKILDTAETLKNAGYAIFASDGELGYMKGDSAWVIDGTLNIDQARYDYMDLRIILYQDGYTTYASSGSAPWYAAMAGKVACLTPDINVWDENFNYDDYAAEASVTTEVFAYGFPSWGILTMRDHVGDDPDTDILEGTAGKWGICAGPVYGFSGGTWLGISTASKNKDLAWEFIKWAVADMDTINWWIETSQGNIPSYIPALEAHADDENAFCGGQKLFQFWLKQAQRIDYSKVTQYDTAIGDAWDVAIDTIETGAGTQKDAMAAFYDTVASIYPEITINK
ncbi:MAG: carbohydrate ABC transporter substrate-binding protein [Lachnospiraceae bacterium]|nr:carbohydrate ABC transporter substrate-binding protein [Lachnospiraceae bacterium]